MSASPTPARRAQILAELAELLPAPGEHQARIYGDTVPPDETPYRDDDPEGYWGHVAEERAWDRSHRVMSRGEDQIAQNAVERAMDRAGGSAA